MLLNQKVAVYNTYLLEDFQGMEGVAGLWCPSIVVERHSSVTVRYWPKGRSSQQNCPVTQES